MFDFLKRNDQDEPKEVQALNQQVSYGDYYGMDTTLVADRAREELEAQGYELQYQFWNNTYTSVKKK